METVKFENRVNQNSKGNQPKWFENGIFYKADDYGKEGFAEVLISRLLHKSNIKYPFVDYNPILITKDGLTINGCMSNNFLHNDEIIVTMEQLFIREIGEDIRKFLNDDISVDERIKYFVESVERTTGLENFGQYITTLLELDAFFLNEDRHLKNIAVIYNLKSHEYSYCTIFDNGNSLLLDSAWDYMTYLSLDECIERANSKPFSPHFDEQLKAAEDLYGVQLRFYFDVNDIFDATEDMMEMYGEDVCVKAGQVITKQIKRYKHLMA